MTREDQTPFAFGEFGGLLGLSGELAPEDTYIAVVALFFSSPAPFIVEKTLFD